jgi:hypothetical protein
MITRDAILKITTEEQMFDEFEQFNTAIEIAVAPLVKKLEFSVMGQDNKQLMDHMIFIECWRDKIGRYFSLAYMLVEHCKSSIFLPEKPESGKITSVLKEAHQKRLSAGFSSIMKDLELKISSIDSRVNLCKKLLDIDSRLSPTRF